MTTRCHDDWGGKGEHPLAEPRPEREHLQHRLSGPAGEDLQVESGREEALTTAQHDNGSVLLGLVEGSMQLLEHRDRQSIDLAIVHRDRRDPVLERIADWVGHLFLLVRVESGSYNVAMFRNNVLFDGDWR